MSMTDPIADMLVRVKNAIRMKHEKVNMPNSRIKSEIATILKEEGYIRNYKLIKDRKQGVLKIYLRYVKNNSVIQDLKRVSKPGCRVYVGKEDIPQVLNGMGLVILSTNQGLLAGKFCLEKRIGGEVLCTVW